MDYLAKKFLMCKPVPKIVHIIKSVILGQFFDLLFF